MANAPSYMTMRFPKSHQAPNQLTPQQQQQQQQQQAQQAQQAQAQQHQQQTPNQSNGVTQTPSSARSNPPVQQPSSSSADDPMPPPPPHEKGFADYTDFVDYIQSWAADHGYAFTTRSSRNDEVRWSCSRFQRKPPPKRDVPEKKRRNRQSGGCDCRMWITAKRKNNYWNVGNVQSGHNHAPAQLSTLPIHRRRARTDEVRSIILEKQRNGYSTTEILKYFIEERPDLPIVRRDISNAKFQNKQDYPDEVWIKKPPAPKKSRRIDRPPLRQGPQNRPALAPNMQDGASDFDSSPPRPSGTSSLESKFEDLMRANMAMLEEMKKINARLDSLPAARDHGHDQPYSAFQHGVPSEHPQSQQDRYSHPQHSRNTNPDTSYSNLPLPVSSAVPHSQQQDQFGAHGNSFNRLTFMGRAL